MDASNFLEEAAWSKFESPRRAPFKLRKESADVHSATSPWPGEASFALVLTHDVDRIRKTFQYLTHLRSGEVWKNLKGLFSQDNPYWNFDRIMRLEEAFCVRSTFFFLQETKKLAWRRPREWVLSLGKYSFHDDEVASVIQRLDQGGWEVGLHGSYDSYLNSDLLREEKRDLEDVLGHEVEGVRQHYLNLEVPATWKIQKDLGFWYDATLGHRDCFGFEGLPRYPVVPFSDGFHAISLILMDGPFFSTLRRESEVRGALESLMAEASRCHGLMVVLWHQRTINPSEFPLQTRAYEFLLKRARELGAWIARARDAVNWWHEQKLCSPFSCPS